MLKYTLWMVFSLVAVAAIAQEHTDSLKQRKVVIRNPKRLFQGITVSADAFGYVGQIFGNDFTSYEAAAELNLKNRFLPIVELGYGSTDYTDDIKDIHYKTAAPYMRIGMNYNFYHQRQTRNIVYAGGRVGYSSFKYDLDGPELTDPYWGGTVPFEYTNIPCKALWFELVVGIRAEVCKCFHMGWSIRYKRKLSFTEHPNAEAWYVPGFGENGSAVFGATYNFIYYLPL